MLRQRLRSRGFALSHIVARLLVIALALALLWYGAMVILLAFKVSPDTVDSISGYRTAYDYLTGLEPDDITSDVRLVVGLAGLAVFLLFGYLAWREIPRPYLARSDLQLSGGDRGAVDVTARAVERVAERAALEHDGVADARGLYHDNALTLEIVARGARDVPATLSAVREQAAESLDTHDLPALPVNVTLTGLDRKNRRELA
jgi:hypothetical protein